MQSETMTEAVELFNFANSESRVWSMVEQSYRNLERRVANGTFDRTKARKLMTNNARDAAREYTREYMPEAKWFDHFPVKVREACGELLLKYWEHETSLGNYWLRKE